MGETFELKSDEEVQAEIDEKKAGIEAHLEASQAPEREAIEDAAKAGLLSSTTAGLESDISRHQGVATEQLPHVGENVDATSDLGNTEPVIVGEHAARTAASLRGKTEELRGEVAAVYDRAKGDRRAPETNPLEGADEATIESVRNRDHGIALEIEGKEMEAVAHQNEALAHAAKMGDGVGEASVMGNTDAAIKAKYHSFEAQSARIASDMIAEKAGQQYDADVAADDLQSKDAA